MNNINKDFGKDKVVIITGATKGLGRAISLVFAEDGYEVIGIYRSDSESAQALESEFKAKKYQGIFIKQDITESEDWIEFNEIIKSRGRKHITIISNACAPFIPKPFHLIDWAEISAQIDVNVKGTFLLFKKALPYMMKSHDGTVIIVLTAALNSPSKGFAAYVTAKSALEGLTKAIANEYQGNGLRVLSVFPGFMETSLTDKWSDHLKASLLAKSKGVFQKPVEIANKVLELAKNTEIVQ